MTQQAVVEVEGAQAPSTRHVSLTFSDGATREITVADGQNVLAAAKEQGIALASQCEVGTCCTCAAFVTSGTATMPSNLVTALTADEMAAGQRLLCQTYAGTDAAFEIEYPSSLLDANPAVRFAAKVSRVTWVAESVVELEVKVPKALKFGFTAGQYCRIRVPGTDEWRSYSMASGEHERTRLTFLIRVLPTGLMSDFLRDEARAGVALDLEGPLGGFALEPSERPHILMAGGTGLAPMLSMLDRLRLVRPTPPILLIFGCVREADLFLLDELAARASFIPTLRVRVALEQDSGLSGVVPGNPVSVLSPDDILGDSIAYLCGPPSMIHAAEDRLAQLGLAHADIRAEQFLPS